MNYVDHDIRVTGTASTRVKVDDIAGLILCITV